MDFDIATTKDANKLLMFLIEQMNKHYLDVMEAELSEAEYTHNYKTLNKNLKDAGLHAAAGAVAAGTGIAKDEAGLSGEAGQRAIQALKKSGRLQQCGRGRGKCLVILNPTPLPEPDENPAEDNQDKIPAKMNAEADQEVVDANNVPSLLRLVRDNYRDIERQLRESRRNETHMKEHIEKLQEQINERDAKIAELENAAQIKAVATWQ